ncbi:MAG TPA: ABC transporter ATP-binding protein [Candidatus Eremiobacteraceae bacterium]|nr:ABC transporter ATP-binding protein [Candidatus Eremiobacteraceae bacterium]
MEFDQAQFPILLTMDVLVADDLYRFYHAGDDETLALRGVSIRVARGETIAVIGPSGSGKSTLLACLAGIDEPDGGTVTVMGRRMSHRPESERSSLRAAYIGVMLQSGNLFDGLTTQQNLWLQMAIARKRDRPRAAEFIDRVGLADRSDAKIETLSGGESARAALAVALSTDPALILADEPTGEVDGATELRLLELFRDRRARGGAMLVVTHSQALASQADRVLHLRDGRLVDGW